MREVYSQDLNITKAQADLLDGCDICIWTDGENYFYSENSRGKKFPVNKDEIGELIEAFNFVDEE